MPVHQCNSSISSSDFRDYSWVRLGLGVGISSSDFRDYSWVRLGLGVGIWLRLYFWIKRLFQGQQNMLTQEHV